MDKFCEGCGWWLKSVDESDDGGFCQCQKFTEDEYYENDMLVYSYREGGEFWTGPKFGCVHWKDKE